jgi:GTP cyclohydrolase II
MFLHLYTNNVDSKEHLAIVFGGNIRSKSLDAVREGETEMDRLVRGAYTGRLYPGRTTSGLAAAPLADPAPVSNHGAEPHPTQVPPLVRIHSECYTGETVWSARCDCGEQLDEAARLMSLPSNKAGGIIIYLRQEGRGIGLGEKLKAYNLQDLGSDTVEANILLRHPADARSYGLATAMLLDLGHNEVRLLTNNPDKIRAVEGPHREVVVRERVAMVPLSWKGRGGFRAPEVEGYLKTKVRLLHPDSLRRAKLTPSLDPDREDGSHAGYGKPATLKDCVGGRCTCSLFVFALDTFCINIGVFISGLSRYFQGGDGFLSEVSTTRRRGVSMAWSVSGGALLLCRSQAPPECRFNSTRTCPLRPCLQEVDAVANPSVHARNQIDGSEGSMCVMTEPGPPETALIARVGRLSRSGVDRINFHIDKRLPAALDPKSSHASSAHPSQKRDQTPFPGSMRHPSAGSILPST